MAKALRITKPQARDAVVRARILDASNEARDWRRIAHCQNGGMLKQRSKKKEGLNAKGDGPEVKPLVWSIFATLILAMTSGCININIRLQPEDTSVKPVLIGRDCVSILLGFWDGHR